MLPARRLCPNLRIAVVSQDHNRASQHASGDVSHWVQGGYAQYEAGSTGPVSGDATHWGAVTHQYEAGSKPVSEWRGNPLGDYAPTRLAASQ